MSTDEEEDYTCAMCGNLLPWPLVHNCSNCDEQICDDCENNDMKKTIEKTSVADYEIVFCPFCRNIFNIVIIMN